MFSCGNSKRFGKDSLIGWNLREMDKKHRNLPERRNVRRLKKEEQHGKNNVLFPEGGKSCQMGWRKEGIFCKNYYPKTKYKMIHSPIFWCDLM